MVSEFLNRTSLTNGDVIITSIISAILTTIASFIVISVCRYIYRKWVQNLLINFRKLIKKFYKKQVNRREYINSLNDYIRNRHLNYMLYLKIKEKEKRTSKENKVLEIMERENMNEIQRYMEMSSRTDEFLKKITSGEINLTPNIEVSQIDLDILKRK